jgi:class 3 adenylate cyclase
MYKERFENLSRVANKLTSSLNVGDILEMIRDEAKVTITKTREACLLVFDSDASQYTRPLHCSVFKDRINCQMCKRGRSTVHKALTRTSEIQCAFYEEQEKCQSCHLGLAIDANPGQRSLSGNSSEPKSPDSDTQRYGSTPCDLAFPIYDGDEPLAVLELIAEEDYCFTEKDATLLKDLTQLTTNAIVNARRHWRMSQDKLNVDSILSHLKPFVPETVKRIVEKNPSAPSFDKQEIDVSILFLDVAGYTKISETLTQEKVHFIIEKYFSSFMDVIYAHGGDINETAGDGLMVIFQGEPSEHAIQAARASLAIRRKTEEINLELQGRFAPIAVNMGINSGAAFVGMNRFKGATEARMTFTATGSVTNLAARIAAASKDGDILVGPETARRIREGVQLFDRGWMEFKNVSEKVQVFSLVRPGG